MKSNTERHDAAREVRRKRNSDRPIVIAFGQKHRGLRPDEVEAFYAKINEIRDQRMAPTQQSLARMRRTG